MDLTLFLIQILNGIQFGLMLFLMSAGLTLVVGIMNFINLAHGSLYMIGAYLAAFLQQRTGSFFAAVLLAVPLIVLLGFLLETTIFKRFYKRDHLDQVLATFAMILFFNELIRIVFGSAGYFMDIPPILSGAIPLFPGVYYPLYRFVIIISGLIVAIGLYLLISKTRMGMLIRAGAENRDMVNALGININLLYMLVFGIGAGLAGFSGMIAGPLLSVQVGMGESILIIAFVVIVIGGIGSVKGAFVAALVTGIADTFGRIMLPPALASMVIYILMATILAKKPKGLFSANG
jgi:branched-chain amino acid transport system permease protein